MYFSDFISALIAGLSISALFSFCVHGLISVSKKNNLNTKSLNKLENHLPAFLDSVCSNLAAGNSLQQSIETASNKGSTQLDVLFQKTLLRVRSGMTLDSSLELEARGLPSGSLSLALVSMAFSYRSGGNMIESFTLLSALCRERDHLRKKILARTAQSRMQGYVLIFVPILFMLFLFIVSPQNMVPVLQSETGKMLLISAATLQCLGGITIRLMLKQDII